MGFTSGPDAGWDDGSDVGASGGEDRGDGKQDGGGENWGGDNHANGTGDNTCHNCGEAGHFAKDCTEPRKFTGECYNCGETGHNKRDCPNPAVDRPFTGTCNLCGEEGHRRAECPQKPAVVCKNCRQEGHAPEDCKEKRVFTFDQPPMDPDAAWDAILAADKAQNLSEFRRLLWEYGRAVGEVDMSDVETTLRASMANYHLVAVEKELTDDMTNIDISGNINRKYTIQIQTSYAPRRKKFSQGFPKGQEENFERLKDAGFTHDKLVMKCRRCGEIGHMAKGCQQEREELSRELPKCALCGSEEHITRACEEPRKKPSSGCRNCGEEGHMKADCPNPTNMDLVTCKECGETGHFVRDCPNKPCRSCGEVGHMSRECPNRVVTCRNCDEEGHMAKECTKCKNCLAEGHNVKECPKPRDWSRFTCPNCGEKGHGRPRCPKPADDGLDGFSKDFAMEKVQPTNGFGNGGFDDEASAHPDSEGVKVQDEEGGW